MTATRPDDMGFLSKWFGTARAQSREIDRLKTTLDSFMRPSMSLADSRDMNVPERRGRYVLFVYGAIHALAAEQELDETERLAILVMYLKTTAGMHEHDVSRLVGNCMTASERPEGERVLAEGFRAMQQWLAGDAGTAVSHLGRVLKG